jgi:NAD(P)-dependent dehydrogenase (short-subunit alcohol dehydrogenase family)
MVTPPPAPQDLLDFRGRVVLVTGSAAGLGAGIARRFAQAGAHLLLHYRANRDGAAQLQHEIQTAYNIRAETTAADLTTHDGVTALFDATRAVFGRLDVLVNNAGIYPLHALKDMPEDAWAGVIHANLTSTFLCTQAAAPLMADTPDSLRAIVNIASIEGTHPAPAHSHYNAAKGAVITFTKSAALELAPDGVRVNAVSPGLIWREGIEANWPDGVARWERTAPLKRLGMPDDVADACLFLASPAARWITGINLTVDGGVTSSPIF